MNPFTATFAPWHSSLILWASRYPHSLLSFAPSASSQPHYHSGQKQMLSSPPLAHDGCGLFAINTFCHYPRHFPRPRSNTSLSLASNFVKTSLRAASALPFYSAESYLRLVVI